MVLNEITLDICKFKNNIYLDVKEDNVNGNAIIVNIKNNNLHYDLTDAIVCMYFKGNTITFIDASILDASKGKIQVNLTTNMLLTAGIFPCGITIYQDGKEINTDTFYLNVVEAIKDVDAIEASNEFTALTNLMNEVGSAIADGITAYEIAVSNGFVGTEVEWLASLKGEQGIQGLQGLQGIQGPKGDKGDTGSQGPIGLTGPKGDQGIQGIKGDKGDTGAQGPIGLTGEQGIQGIQGPAGNDGTNGTNGIDGINGTDGDSAYEVAVNNGFIGTEIEWLASLQGPQGIQGINGIDGLNGTDGLSAYQIALNNGFVGTEIEWLASLQGNDGIQGVDGADGLSAYQVAVNNGFIGTESEWLLSLKGQKGDKGDTGDVGPAGANGLDGLSAYEVAVQNGFVGTEAEWLASLQGEGGGGSVTIDETTPTTFTGILKGTGTNVTTATAGTDYLTSADIPVGESVNVETLTGNKTLTTSDATWQLLNSNGNREVILPDGTTTKNKFIISNTNTDMFSGPYLLTIKYSGTTITTIASKSYNYLLLWDGTTWIAPNSQNNVMIGYGAKGRLNAVAIGYNANANTWNKNVGGVAIGYNASAFDSFEAGVAIGVNAKCDNQAGFGTSISIGNDSTSKTYGVSVGKTAISNGYGTAIGNFTSTNSKNYAFAKGYRSKCERWNEEWKCSDGAATNKYGYGTLNWYGETTDATETEIFLGGTSNQRATVLASSAYTFSLLCIAYCNAGTKGKSIKIEGGIRRDGANNTTLIGTPTTTVLSEDGTTNYTITVSADDTNEALKITVTGADAETVRWNITGNISECRF